MEDEEFGPLLGRHLVAERAQRGRRAGDRRQRRAQVVGEGGEQRVAHLFVLLHRGGVDRLAGQQDAIERDRGLVEDRGEGPFVVAGNRLIGRMRLETADRDRPARGDERAELELDVRQRAGAPAGRLVLLLRPAGGGHGGRVELRVGRPGGAQVELVALGHQQHDPAAEHGMQMRRRRPQHVVGVRRARELARIIVERPHDVGVLDHAFALVAHASRHRSGQDRYAQKDQQGEQFLRLGDGEGVEGLDEEEVEGDERQERGDHRRAGAEAHAGEQHGGEKDHRQVRQLQRRRQRLPDHDRAGDRADRHADLGAEPFRIERQFRQAPLPRLRLLVRHDMDFDRPGAAHDRVRQGAAEQARQGSRARLAEHDLGHVLAPRKAQDLLREIIALEPGRVGAEPLGQAERLGDLVGLLGVVDRGRPARCRRPSRRR